MSSPLKLVHKNKKVLFWGLLLVVVLVVTAATRKVRIIDKSRQLMRSSSKQYRTRSLDSINQIFVHHSASIGQTAEDYARYHVQSRGWPGIGYHFVIEVNGDIIQGNPLTNVSYNVAGHNTRGIGICLSGDFTRQEPSAAQLKSLGRLIAHLRRQLPQSLAVNGHKEFGQTSCPGHHLEKHLYKFQ
ncbi:peptidoglycan recognition family protein [Aureispira sp. CCB-E]|uniref:peptidoglycan recognition protein family protein n=1 Tax=Aureispira sp. CCB-E TaxID=3051121 RepID=UPI00286939AE|nr:peptidoglycan recognition family protein [Aureispira sp. CCB-E]WMX16565.1 peptidoglycan recognition family protein [Aureispira sp. CCB-E]